MDESPNKGVQVQSGHKFGLAGYWVNVDQTHPVRLLYEPNPEAEVPIITEKLIFIYFGERKPNPLEISSLIAESYPHY
ncbi:MAG: hypothetical protein H0T84_06665 [Tatlockia sp.]|nr:hypothetical protein [Tatlockia sp.]